MRRCDALTAAALFPEVAQQAGIAVEHQYTVAIGKAIAIGFKAAIERVELGISAVGLGVDFRRLGLAFPTTPLGVALGFGAQNSLLPIVFGTVVFRVPCPLTA